MSKNLIIIKNRSDIGAGTRGSDLGVDALEIAAINENNPFFNEHPFKDVDTINESIYNKVKNSFAKRIVNVYEQCSRLSDAVKISLLKEEFPLVISGDHSSALGSISGVKAAHPNKKLGVIWIDAHADLHTPYTSPSGNIHGMPLGAAIADDNMDCQINQVHEETIKYWNALKNIDSSGPQLSPEHIVYFGVRSTEEAENKQIDKYGIRNFKVAEVRHLGIEACVAQALEILADTDLLYISFDVDSMDPDMISYGTGTPVPFGFDPTEITGIINKFLESNKVACLEFVEINPLLDNKGNTMAETAFKVLKELKF